MLKKRCIPAANIPNKELNLPPDDDAHKLFHLLNITDRPINTNNYKVPMKQIEPTYSVVEVHQPKLAPPDTNIRNMPDSENKIDAENKV